MTSFGEPILVLVIVNIALVAFSYGQLYQKVKDMSRRVGRLEDTINGKGGNISDKRTE